MLYTIPSTSALPSLVRRWRTLFQQHLSHSSVRVRTVAISVLFAEVKQGLEYPIDCIQNVTALLLDENAEVCIWYEDHSWIEVRRITLSSFLPLSKQSTLWMYSFYPYLPSNSSFHSHLYRLDLLHCLSFVIFTSISTLYLYLVWQLPSPPPSIPFPTPTPFRQPMSIPFLSCMLLWREEGRGRRWSIVKLLLISYWCIHTER